MAYEAVKGSFSRLMRLLAKLEGPFRMAKDPSSVMEPKAKSSANFCGATGRSGRKEKDMEIRKTPMKKTAANCASLAGDMARAANPEKPCVTLPAPALAAALTDPAAFEAFSLAAFALAAPKALASASFSWLLPCSSLAFSWAFFPFSDSADLACFACSARSLDLALSATCATPCFASLAASFTSLAASFTLLAAALAHKAHLGGTPPCSRSAASLVASAGCAGACGTAS
mmetsp:Transcript_76195/g.215605  ORF Transcript_76195/g.215605 Transcript_76195/m.215605 type:complete len:230 (+) Transcript_76195:542-1231(+)